MTLKRITNKRNKKARNCLKCNRRLKNLKDNVVNTCEGCGQQHLVDFYEGDIIALTVAERPELRRRPGESKEVSPEYAQNQEAFNKRLERFRRNGREKTMFIKVFLASVVVLALLGCIGANQKENKKLAAGIAVVALILFTAVMVGGSSKKEDEPTAVAPESGKITVDQNQWGTITVTDRETGVTREYQGCIHISGSYPYETYEYMGLCVSMDAAIEIAEWSPGTYRLFYEDEETYWKMKEEQQQAETEAEKEKKDNE